VGGYLVPFKSFHRAEILGGLNSMPASMVAELERSLSFTLMLDKKPIAAGGIITLMPGVGSAWVFVSPAVKENVHRFHRTVVRSLRSFLPKFRRIQADVHDEFTMGHRWIKSLGFAFESTMPLAGLSGETLKRYVILNKD